MSSSQIAVLVALLVVYILVRRRGAGSSKGAAEALAQGGVVIDVRSASEFAGGHLPQAIHLPLDEFEQKLPQRIADKEKPLLLHCQSGMRSSSAARIARELGYKHVFNLGSYGNAKKIVRTAR